MNDIPISPFRIRWALENSAKRPLNDGSHGDVSPLAIGQGLLQVDNAFELLKKADTIPKPLTTIQIDVNEVNGSVKSIPMRGVYLREKHNTVKTMDFLVFVTPQFRNEDSGVPFLKNISGSYNFKCF